MPGLRKLTFAFVRMIAGVFFLELLFLFLLICGGLLGDLESFVLSAVFFLILIGIVFLILVVYGIVGMSFSLKAKDKLRNIPGFDIDRFEREVKRAPKMKNVVVCSDAICYLSNGNLIRVIPIQDIVWAYQGEEQKNAYLQIYCYDKTEHRIPVLIKKRLINSEKACRYILRLIARKSPGTLIGYEEIYEKMVKNDFQQLLFRAQGKTIVNSAALEQEYIANNYYVQDFQ